MSSRSKEQVARYHLHLYVRDMERVDALFGHRLSRAEAIRELVRRMLDRVEERGKIKIAPLQVPDDLGLPELPPEPKTVLQDILEDSL